MAGNYTFSEMTDMIKVLGFCNGNFRECVREYRERYPNRRIPDRRTVAKLERNLRERGCFDVNVERGRQREVRQVAVEEEVLENIEDDPKISSRRLASRVGTSKSTIHRIIREQQLYPFHVQPVQHLLEIDFNKRLRFCQAILERRMDDINFHKKILFTDEACFTRIGSYNLHNEHVYNEENPHAIIERHFQANFRINVWAGLIDNYLIGPVRLPNNLNGENYLHFLETGLPQELENVPLQLRTEMWFMHDGAPPHFTRNVRAHLHTYYENRWIGRGNDAAIEWAPRSPDLNACDFFLWGALKAQVYAAPIRSEEELWNRISAAFNSLGNANVLADVHFNFLRRIIKCTEQNGGHIEHLL